MLTNTFYFKKMHRGINVNSSNYSNSAISKYKLNKELTKFIGGGYMSYKNVVTLGYLIELIDNKPLFVNKLINYLANLDDNKTYTLLPVIRWIDEDTGLTQSISITESIKLTKFVDIDLIYEKINDYIIKAMYRYQVNNSNIELVLMNRV